MRPALPPAAAAALDVVVAAASRANVRMLWGQGSLVSGFRVDADLDLVAVLDGPPAERLLEGSHFAQLPGIALEQTVLGGQEVDLMQVSSEVIDAWLADLPRLPDRSYTPWPEPVHVAAGLAEGVVLLDPSGDGAVLQRRLRTPDPSRIAAERTRLEAELPVFAAQLEVSARRDPWLFDDLATLLHRDVYTTWFLLEGHYPPFPKDVELWLDRFGMDARARAFESAVWAAPNRTAAGVRLVELAGAVLSLAVSAAAD